MVRIDGRELISIAESAMNFTVDGQAALTLFGTAAYQLLVNLLHLTRVHAISIAITRTRLILRGSLQNHEPECKMLKFIIYFINDGALDHHQSPDCNVAHVSIVVDLIVIGAPSLSCFCHRVPPK
jgi:hypothetical protein